MARRGQLAIDDCEKCMKNTSQLQRQSLACGYEPAANGRVHLAVWQPPSGAAGYKGPALETCAGYTANLPEVGEAALARRHWKVGAIGVACGGEVPTDDLLHAIVILDNECGALEGWQLTPVAEGGGR